MKSHKIIQKSALGLAGGLGSSKNGTQHWWQQRVTSVALIFLGLWIIFAFVHQIPQDYQGAVAWLKSPIHVVLFALTIAIGLYHGALGLQEVIEDYIHTLWLKVVVLYIIKSTAVVLGVGSVVALLKIFYMPL